MYNFCSNVAHIQSRYIACFILCRHCFEIAIVSHLWKQYSSLLLARCFKRKPSNCGVASVVIFDRQIISKIGSSIFHVYLFQVMNPDFRF